MTATLHGTIEKLMSPRARPRQSTLGKWHDWELAPSSSASTINSAPPLRFYAWRLTLGGEAATVVVTNREGSQCQSPSAWA
jgi:hypothetical protein